MPSKSKKRSVSRKPQTKPNKKKTLKSQKHKAPKQQVKQVHNIRQKKSLSRSQAKSQEQKTKPKVAPLKKKITKNKKKIQKKPVVQQQKKQQQKKVEQSKSSKSKSQSKSPSKQVIKNKKIKKEKPQKPQKQQKSQKPQKSKTPEKKKEKSYFEILYDYITSYDKSHSPDSTPQNEKRPYQLIEDIKIIYSVAQDDKHEGLGPVFWNELANKKIIQRPVESMRDRYKRYIRFLDKTDFDKIIQYLREQGTEGFMIFSKGDDGNKKLVNIQLQDPSIKIPQNYTFEGVPKPKDQKSLELLRNIMQKKQEIKTKKQFPNKIEEKLFPIVSDTMTSNFKKIVVQAAKPIIKQNEAMLSTTLLEELPIMKQVQNQAAKSLECINQTSYKIHTNFQGHRYSSQQKITDIKDLNSVVNMLHFQFGKARQEIIEDLQDVNGNIQSLIQIYQNPTENAHLKWTQEDDNILKQCKTKDDISLKLLIRYKGEESVKNRIKFKKLVLPFTF